MSTQIPSGQTHGLFPRTRWSVVLAATGKSSRESAQALEVLCGAYWRPLYAFARRAGQSPHDAQDLTQDFFAELLARRWLEAADRTKGRLRTFLIAAFKHFMHKEWRRESAQKRGGGREHVQLDTAAAESLCAPDANITLAPDDLFDRHWALTVLELTLKRLEDEFAAAGKAGDFQAMKGCLMAAHGAINYDDLARQLEVNAGAARVAVHRLRKRFRELYRDEISQTLGDGADLEGEVRHLAAVLAREE